jgi:hypothetical protein
MTPTSSLQWAQLQDAFAAGDVLASTDVCNMTTFDTLLPHSLQRQAAVNQQVLAAGEVLPAVTLANGNVMQTGTVAAMLLNIERYNRGERGDVEQQLALAVPTLVKIGLFDLFSPAEWTRTDNAGRRLVGLFAEQYLAGPQK